MRKVAINFKKTFDVLGQGLMYRPTQIAKGMKIPGGPVQGFLASSAVGAGLGYGVGSLVNTWSGDDDEEKRRRARRWAVLGGLATGIPAAVKSFGMAESTVPRLGAVNGLFNVTPETPKVASMGWAPEGVSSAINAVASSNEMTPFAKTLGINMILDANREKPGLLSFGQLAKAGIGAGLGVLGGTIMARILTSMLGLPVVGTKTFMRRGGGLVGALTGAGFVG